MRLSSSLGFAFLFYALARGGLYCSDSVSFEKIVNSINTFDLQALVTTPFTLAEIVSYCEQRSAKFPRLRLAMTAGSLVSRELATRVRDLICERLVLFYGTTETGVIASLWEPGESGDVGIPVPGIRADIIAPDGRVVPAGQVGTVRIQAASGPLPFFSLPDWQQRIPSESFCPGDVGSFNEHGHLMVHGREDTIINIGGTKTAPEALEQAILAAPGVRDCGVVCKADEYGIDRIVAVLVLNPYWDQAKFLAYCEANILRDFLPSKFVLVKEILRNRNNKIDREALAKLT
jgi:fatty-acyl-CoA synthase